MPSDLIELEYSVRAESSSIADKLIRAALDSARALASAGDRRGALDGYEDALTLFAEHFAGRIEEAERSELAELCTKAASEADAIIQELETPEFEASLPVRDLLSPSERVKWKTSDGARATFDDQTMQLTAGEAAGIVSFGVTPPESWHDIVLDLEFKLVSGGFEHCLRSRPGKWCSYRIIYTPEEGWELDKTHQVTIRLRGTSVERIQPEFHPSRDRLVPTKQSSRAGGIGFTVLAGSKVTISVCKLIVLRARR